MQYRVAEKIADVGAGSSVAAFLGISLIQWDLVISIAVGLVAVVAGSLAAWFHALRIRAVLKEKDKDA